jgi:hypothetical protein
MNLILQGLDPEPRAIERIAALAAAQRSTTRLSGAKA